MKRSKLRRSTRKSGISCFGSPIKAQFEALGKGELIESLERCHAALIERRRSFVDFGNPDLLTEPARALANCRVTRQALLHRAERLSAACATMIAQRNVYGMTLLIRGHFEATAVMGYLCHRVSSFRNGALPFDTVAWNLAQVLMGGRHSLFEKMPDPISIMTCIEKADRYIERKDGGGRKDMLSDCYAWLSEFAHPNFNSNDSAFKLEGTRMVFRHDAELTPDELSQLGYLDISGTIFPDLFDDLEEHAVAAFAYI